MGDDFNVNDFAAMIRHPGKKGCLTYKEVKIEWLK
jgi:hypothetical protein